MASVYLYPKYDKFRVLECSLIKDRNSNASEDIFSALSEKNFTNSNDFLQNIVVIIIIKRCMTCFSNLHFIEKNL